MEGFPSLKRWIGFPIWRVVTFFHNSRKNTVQGINISHLGKRNIIFKMPFLGDMLVPWRVSKQHLWKTFPTLPFYEFPEIYPSYPSNVDGNTCTFWTPPGAVPPAPRCPGLSSPTPPKSKRSKPPPKGNTNRLDVRLEVLGSKVKISGL